jgi:hypothetical protein
MSFLLNDIELLYRNTFGGKPYRINGQKEEVSQLSGSALTADYLGKEIWLPVKFVNLNKAIFGATEVLLPYSVIKMSAKKTIVKTPLVERKGTVKELYSIDDFNISLKGFVIDEENRIWPEQELTILKKLFDLNEAIEFDNALSNIFLDKDTRVVIENLELPEVEGGRKHIRPFSLTLESDSVFTLELETNV